MQQEINIAIAVAATPTPNSGLASHEVRCRGGYVGKRTRAYICADGDSRYPSNLFVFSFCFCFFFLLLLSTNLNPILRRYTAPAGSEMRSHLVQARSLGSHTINRWTNLDSMCTYLRNCAYRTIRSNISRDGAHIPAGEEKCRRTCILPHM